MSMTILHGYVRRAVATVLGTTLALAASASWAQSESTYFVTSTGAAGPGTLPDVIAQMQPTGTQILRFQLPPNSEIVLLGSPGTLRGIDIVVDGSDVPGLVINGNGTATIFRAPSAQTVTVRNVILRNGRGPGAGCLSSNATLSTQVFDSQFINCRTDGTPASGSSGGAVFAFGPLRLTRTYFEGNIAADGGIDNLGLGGGAVAVSGTSVLIENTRFVNNLTLRTPNSFGGCTDGLGGALIMSLASGASATLTGVSFTGNSNRCGTATGAVSGQAGALSVLGPGSGTAPFVALDSTFFGGNLADNGAAIFARAVQLTATNSTFHQNIGRGAGAIFLTTGFGASPPTPELRLQSSTFWRNGTSFGNFGADLTLNAAVIVRAMRNVLFAAPTSGGSCAPASFNADTGDVVFTTGTTCFVTVAGNNITAQFADGNSFGLQAPADNGGVVPTLDLAPGSVAIDNGTNVACPPRDARNVVRPFDGDANGVATCDVGSIEFRPNALFSNGFE